MLTRSLIAVFVLLNLIVATWWALRDPAPASTPTPAGATQGPTKHNGLRFVAAGEAPASDLAWPEAPALVDVTPQPVVKPTADIEPAAPTPVVAAPLGQGVPIASGTVVGGTGGVRCVALGPFAGQSQARVAQQEVAALLTQARLQPQAAAGGSTRYRVMLPAAASRAEAQATVERIGAAGLGEYFIISQGPEANAIALGQYRNRSGAEQRLAQVRAAGFNAQLSGGDSVTWWVHGRLADGASLDTARQRSGATRQESLDCARLR